MHADSGSFRDPANRVYVVDPGADGSGPRILRGLREDAWDIFGRLKGEGFFQELLADGDLVPTRLPGAEDPNVRAITADGWRGVLEHDPIPFLSYPYEWTFSMLKDAALLQLRLLEKSLENGWCLKDATPYNIQWRGARPVFIDLVSFQPREPGAPWVGYRQFCSGFLIPLLLRAHLGINHLPLLRSCIEGIPPAEASKYFSLKQSFKKGVISHVIFPAKVEKAFADRERRKGTPAPALGRKQSKAMVVGLLQSLRRLVSGLSLPAGSSAWSEYGSEHSYGGEDLDRKKAFVVKHASSVTRSQVWDLGCNTGTFSRLAGPYCSQVIALDSDHDAVERLYVRQKQSPRSNVLPLVMNLANPSPAQGWGGVERKAFHSRRNPDLVLCLALIHHLRIGAGVPVALFLRWLRSLNAEVVLEFVDRADEMVIRLLNQKDERYEDYDLEPFVEEAEKLFRIEDREALKNGKRVLFFLSPR